jgi:hypothetical protein
MASWRMPETQTVLDYLQDRLYGLTCKPRSVL